MRIRTFVFSVAVLLSALAAEAQVSTGSIIGIVRDESNAVLPGVTVVLTSQLMPGGPATEVTNAQGEYRFTRLAPGSYELKVSLPGFGTYQETDLRVAVGGTTERAVTLKLGAVTETITVSGESPVVDTRKSGITNNIAAEQLEASASERYGAQAYMAMLPGVTTGNYNRVFNVTVMGSNSNETTILTDGVSINNVRTGGSWLLTDFDGAAEVSTTTLGASAEYQAAGGGIMNVVGKTGTNDFHGDASAFWSPDALTSKPRKLPCATCEGGESGFTWYKYRDFGAHIGGPINRDNLWFFTGLIYRARFGTSPGQAPPPPEEQFLDMITDTNTKVTLEDQRQADVPADLLRGALGDGQPQHRQPDAADRDASAFAGGLQGRSEPRIAADGDPLSQHRSHGALRPDDGRVAPDRLFQGPGHAEPHRRLERRPEREYERPPVLAAARRGQCEGEHLPVGRPHQPQPFIRAADFPEQGRVRPDRAGWGSL